MKAFSLQKVFKYLVFLIPVITILLAMNTSPSADERIQIRQAKNVLSFFETLGEDSAALKPRGINPDHYYGSSFDVFCQFLIESFNIQDYFKLRHIFNGLCGALIIIFCGFFGRLIKGEGVGIIAMLLAFFSPRLLGHSFNNPKDIPFALGYIMSLYFMAKWFLNFDKKDRKTIVFLILSIAFTNSVRIGGMILYGYLGLFFLITAISKAGLKNVFQYKRQIITAFIVVIASYFLGLVLWPFGLVSPLKNPFEALSGFEKFAIGINQLFDGEYVNSKSLPSNYLFQYILITVPVIVFVGALIFVFKQLSDKQYRNKMIHYLLVFATVFPLAYIVYKGSNVYGGWRQVIFVYPPLVIISAIGLGTVRELFETKLPKFKWAFWIVLFGAMIHPIKHIINNHPYEYIYFNESFGGIEEAYGKYEMDYYFHSTKEAALWLKEYIAKNNPTDTIIVSSNHSDYEYYLEDNKKIKGSYARFYDRYQKDWDFYICGNTYINPHQLKHDYWPPEGTIHKIMVDDIPICAIIKRPSKDDYKGYQLMKQNQFVQAIPYFQKYLKLDPTNCSVWAALASCYNGLRQPDVAIKYANESLKYYKNYAIGLDMMGRAYLSKREYDNAIATYDVVINEKPSYFMAYYFQAIAYQQKKDYNTALKKAQLCLSYKNNFKPMFKVVAQIYQSQGNTELAKKFYEKAK